MIYSIHYHSAISHGWDEDAAHELAVLMCGGVL